MSGWKLALVVLFNATLTVMMDMVSRAHFPEFTIGEVIVPYRVIGMFLEPFLVGCLAADQLRIKPLHAGVAAFLGTLVALLVLSPPGRFGVGPLPFACLLSGMIAYLSARLLALSDR